MNMKAKSAVKLIAVLLVAAVAAVFTLCSFQIGGYEIKPIVSNISQGLDLRGARHEAGLQASPGRGRTWRWLTATAFSAVLAVGIGLQWLPRTPAVPASTPVAAAIPSDGDAIADELGVAGTFDEDPDLYLWLASAEAQPLAMESTR